jgi:hypothetical protein
MVEAWRGSGGTSVDVGTRNTGDRCASSDAMAALVVMLSPCLAPLLVRDAVASLEMRRTVVGLWRPLHSEARGKTTLPQLADGPGLCPDCMCLSCTLVETYTRLTTPIDHGSRRY